MNDHPITSEESVALEAAYERARGAFNYWVQHKDPLDSSSWITRQYETDRAAAANDFASLASRNYIVLFGADGGERMIVCTSPEYENWANHNH